MRMMLLRNINAGRGGPLLGHEFVTMAIGHWPIAMAVP
jgi:hypothetical protein